LKIKNSYIEKEFNYFIDARIPKGNLKLKNNLLFERMQKKGYVREIVNGKYENGKIAVQKDGRLIGNINNALIYLYGIPTDGTFLQNDSLSRKINNFSDEWSVATMDRIAEKYSCRNNKMECIKFSSLNYINLTSN
jgi:hypothetical protein